MIRQNFSSKKSKLIFSCLSVGIISSVIPLSWTLPANAQNLIQDYQHRYVANSSQDTTNSVEFNCQNILASASNSSTDEYGQAASEAAYYQLEQYSPQELPTLNQDSTGERVRQLQLFLEDQGYYDTTREDLSIDGIYGKGTASAVEQFQRIHDLSNDSIVGSQTWQAIINRIEEILSVPPSQRHTLSSYLPEVCRRVQFLAEIYSDNRSQAEVEAIRQYRQTWQSQYDERAKFLGHWYGPFGVAITLIPTSNPNRVCVQYQDEYGAGVESAEFRNNKLLCKDHVMLLMQDRLGLVLVWYGQGKIGAKVDVQDFPSAKIPATVRDESFQEQYEQLGCQGWN